MTLAGAALASAAASLAVVLARRWGVWAWLSVLAGIPTIAIGLSAPFSHQLALLVLAAGVTIACWRPRTDPTLIGAGVLLAGVAAIIVQVGGTSGRHVLDDRLPWIAIVVAALIALTAAAIPRPAWLAAVRVTCLVTTLLPLALLIGALSTDALTAWWPVAGVIGFSVLLRGERRPSASAAQCDEVDTAAIEDFDARYGAPDLAPVVIVIAAYNEAAGLPEVLAALPSSVCDLPADVVVVDDGSTDATAEAAQGSGLAYVVRCERNRGQGAALRLGYRVAREHGAAYLITTDADGQYDVADLPNLLAPILAGDADFVTGSRRLGAQPVQDPLRRIGVHVFAWLVSALVGQHLTDTSFGMRAMRAETTAAVTLNQPQYQSSELLIGMFSHGYRVFEVPGTMHARGSGASKKGRNLTYGRHYAGVVFGTWWREACPTPLVAAPAAGLPLMRGSQHNAASSRQIAAPVRDRVAGS